MINTINAEAQKSASKHETTMKRATVQLNTLRAELDNMTRARNQTQENAMEIGRELATLQDELQRTQSRLAGVIGLKGPMRNLAILFDTSESLGTGPRAEEKFQEYKQLLKNWISSLGFDRLSVLRFHTAVESVPEWEDRLVAANDSNRTIAAAFVDAAMPGGTTNTMGALQHVFLELEDVDTIILFSDGQPNGRDGKPNGGEPATKWILDYVARTNHRESGEPKIVINTIAIGDYLNATYGEFLRDLARMNGGAFLGR